MKKKAVHAILITAVFIVLAVLGSAIYCFTRPSVNIVMTEAEELLFASYLPSGLFEKYRVRVSLYPEVRKADYVLYSPAAGARAVGDGSDFSGGSAVWGLADEDLPFQLAFIPDETARWQVAYGTTGSPLLSAVVYDSSSEKETELAARAPSSVLRFSYDRQLSRVGADVLRGELDANGVSSLIIYSPVNTLELLSTDEGYDLTVPLLYANVFETVELSHLTSEDFLSMFQMLEAGLSGRVETPYILLESQKGIKVLLDKLF